MAEPEQIEQHVHEEAPRPGPKRIATIFAHPDDADFTCAGSVARWVAEGHHVTHVILTNGDKGSDRRDLGSEELIAIREEEQLAANAILGVQDTIFMRYADGMLVPTLDLRREVVRVIRRITPDIVVCGDPTVYFVGKDYLNHPDHRAAAQVALEAIFPAARNHRMFPELLEEGLEPHRVDEIYLSTPELADTFIDITAYMDIKIAALRAHASQMGDWDPDGPIREWNSEDGKKHDPPVKYAEDYRYMRLE